MTLAVPTTPIAIQGRAPAPATGGVLVRPTPADEHLAALAAAGDRAAFDRLVDRYADRVFSFIRTRVRDPHDAEEAAQETFLRAWAAIGRFDPHRTFSTWLFTIAHRLAADTLRRRRSRTAQLDETATDPAPDTDRSRGGEAWRLARELLSESAYEILYLTYAEEKTAAEVARITGRTPIFVRVSLHRARERLRRALDAHETEGTDR